MPATLLIVEDMPDVARSYVLVFRRFLSDIQVAATPEEAEAILGRSAQQFQLLCDNWLGDGVPTGLELIPRWKKSYPNLVKAALVTGSNTGVIQGVAGIDGVFEKPPDIRALAEFFGLQDAG